MKNNDKYFHFKGVKEEREAPEEKTKRLQREFKKKYNSYMMARQKAVNQVIWEEIIN